MTTTENFRTNVILEAWGSALNRIENGLSPNPREEAFSAGMLALAVNSAESDDEIEEIQRVYTPGFTGNLADLFNSWGRDGSIFLR